jgi:hypothetical protein
MPTPKKRYYSTKDVQTILGVSRSKANQIMHMFAHRGQLLVHGNTLRVEISVFEDWCKEQTIHSTTLKRA